VIVSLLLWLGCAPHTPTPAPPISTPLVDARPTLASLDFPGDPVLASAARAVLETLFELHPDLPASTGLLADGLRLPSYSPEAVARQLVALDVAALRLGLIEPRKLSVADRIDHTLLVAAVESARHSRAVEQRWRHRPAEWLEPLASILMAHSSAPDPIPGAMATIAEQVPAMIDEMRSEVTAPTRQDTQTALGLLDGLAGMFEAQPGCEAAAIALRDYHAELSALPDDLPEMQMIGAEAYRWRLEHALLLAWSPEELLARAEAELEVVEAEIMALSILITPHELPTAEEEAIAASLDAAGFLALHDRMVSDQLSLLRGMGVLTVPADLLPLRARPTPAALIPLTGDGGSMSPVAPFGVTEGAWWNVEQFRDIGVDGVVDMYRHQDTWFGPYAAHEGVPGHHLQLAITRDNPRPVRKLLQSTPAVEGWALYAEELFEQNGGFGGAERGRLLTLNSYRARIKRVIFDVRVETGEWTLQQAADWKHGAAPGEGRIDPELLRTVQWPTQLISYYAGKAEIVALRAELEAAWGEAFSEQAFHDALLAEGPIPVSLAREALLAAGP